MPALLELSCSRLSPKIAEPPSKNKTYDDLADWFAAHADIDLFSELYL